MADNLGDAAGAAKKLKQYTAGFDELNVFDPNQGAGGAGAGVSGGGYEGEFDIDKLWDESIFENINSQVDELKENLKGVLSHCDQYCGGYFGVEGRQGFFSGLETSERTELQEFCLQTGLQSSRFVHVPC